MIKNLFIPSGEPEAKVKADLHWMYIKSILELHGENSNVIRQCGAHYRAAFIHGWKHGVEHSHSVARLTDES